MSALFSYSSLQSHPASHHFRHWMLPQGLTIGPDQEEPEMLHQLESLAGVSLTNPPPLPQSPVTKRGWDLCHCFLNMSWLTQCVPLQTALAVRQDTAPPVGLPWSWWSHEAQCRSAVPTLHAILVAPVPSTLQIPPSTAETVAGTVRLPYT